MDLEFNKEIGDGAYGRVWLATDIYLPRKYAVKFFDRNPDTAQYEALVHARSLARVDHPAVVRLHSFEDQTHPETKVKAPALIMEYIEGSTLEQVRTTLAGQHADRVVADMIAGVEAIHAAGIIHGDIYDKNILITHNGAKIIDIICRLSPGDFGTRTAHITVRDDLRALANVVRQVLERRENINIRELREAYYQASTHAASTSELRLAYAAVCPGLAAAISDPALRSAIDESRFLGTLPAPTSVVPNTATQLTAASADASSDTSTVSESAGDLLLKDLASFGLKDLLTPTIHKLIHTSPKEDLHRFLKVTRHYQQTRDAQRRIKNNRDPAGPLLAKLWRAAVARTTYPPRDVITHDGRALTVKNVYFDERAPRETSHMVEQLTKQPDVGITLPQGRYFYAREAPELTMHIMRGAIEAIYRLGWDSAVMNNGTTEGRFFEKSWLWGGVKLPEDIRSNLSEVIFLPAVCWRRFADGERLEASWNEAVTKIRNLTEKSKAEHVWQIESLVYWYVKSCFLNGMGKNIDSSIKMRPSPQDWMQASELIRQLLEGPHETYVRTPLESFLSRLPQLTVLEEHLSAWAKHVLLQAGHKDRAAEKANLAPH